MPGVGSGAGGERLGENRPPVQGGGTGRTCRTGTDGSLSGRLRGWYAEVMPFNPQETPWFQPNLNLTDPEGWFCYGEVET